MQINKTNSPSFNALRISPKAAENLKKCDIETLKKIEKAGRDLANTKFVDMTISENLWCRLFADRRAFVKPNKYIAIGDYTVVRENFLGEPFDNLTVFQSKRLLRSVQDIDKMAKIAVSIDKEALKHSNKPIDMKQNVNDAVDRLIRVYGE